MQRALLEQGLRFFPWQRPLAAPAEECDPLTRQRLLQDIEQERLFGLTYLVD